MHRMAHAVALSIVLLLAACSEEGKDAGAAGDQWAISLESSVSGLAVDDSGSLYITGPYEGQADLGSATLTSKGARDAFVAKLSPAGEPLWAVSAGGPGGETAGGIVVDESGSIFVTGSFDGDADFGAKSVTSSGISDLFVARLTTDGTFEWISTGGGTGIDGGVNIAADNAGSIVVSGILLSQESSFGDITVDGLLPFGFVAKLGPDGSFVWVTPYRSILEDGVPVALGADTAGNSYVAGHIKRRLTPGDTTLPLTFDISMFVAKLSPAGKLVWARSVISSKVDEPLVRAKDIAVDKSGKIYLTGDCEGSTDFGGNVVSCHENGSGFVTKLTADGTFLWAKSLGGGGKQFCESLAVDPQGDIYALCRFKEDLFFETGTLANKGEYDLLVTKLSPSGELVWAKSAGGESTDFGEKIAVGKADEIYVSGGFMGNAVFDGVVLSAAEEQLESFIWKVKPPE